MADEGEKPAKRAVSTKAIQRLTRISNDRKHALKAAQAELETVKATNAELAKRPTSEDLQKKADALEAKLRTVTHRQAFDAEARAAGVHPSAFEDAFNAAVASGYKVEGDSANPELVKAAIGSVKEAKPFLFSPASTEATTTTAATKPPLQTKPVESKGGSVAQPVAGQIRRSDLRDPRKALTIDPKALSQAIKEGTIVDD